MEIWARAARFEGLTCNTCWKSAMARLNSLQSRRASPRRYSPFSLYSSNSITFCTKQTKGNLLGRKYQEHVKTERQSSKDKMVFNHSLSSGSFKSPCCSSPLLARTPSFADSTMLNWDVMSEVSLLSFSALLRKHCTPFLARKWCAGTEWLPGTASLPGRGR